ncbi:MAG TPA: Ig-like domain-containing protein [Candidatus Limnocylindrales bacterium]|nr:Ig-like domain-containing protein [Candidatus Limnocylindrales bacterium]
MGLLLVSSCTSPPGAPKVEQAAPAAPVPVMKAEITPADKATDLPISTEIGTSVSDGEVQEVTLVDAQGGKVAGGLRADKSSFVPDEPLKFAQTYTATVVAKGADRVETLKTTFTTMADPHNRGGTGLYLQPSEVYGVAMPMVVEFTSDVEDGARAGVQKRLFVTTNPDQPGVWSWTGPRQVTYRARDYWRPGTTITVRAALDGVPFGGGRYGDTDRRASVKITPNPVELFIDNGSKQLKVKENGTETRSIPVSLGKPSTPSSSGVMVIMDKRVRTVFDTTGEPGDQYVADISYAQRLTWGGEFIHAAPWSVGDQGVRNVSHGCVNMSWANAEWLFGVTHIGDPVTVVGTEQALANGNGFTAWNQSWDEHVKGSALPGR